MATTSVTLQPLPPGHPDPFSTGDCLLLLFRWASLVDPLNTWDQGSLDIACRFPQGDFSLAPSAQLTESCPANPEMGLAVEMAQAEEERGGRCGLPVDALSG